MRTSLAGGAGLLDRAFAGRFLDSGGPLSIIDDQPRRSADHDQGTGVHMSTRTEDVFQLPTFDGLVDAVLPFTCPASPVDHHPHLAETLEAGAATRRLLEIAKEKQARFLLASTPGVHGDASERP